MSDRVAALSVDLDEIGCYTAIHGLPAPSGRAARAVYAEAIPRFEALFDSLGVRATFFVIGRDVTPENAAVLKRLSDAGHELANHSLDHYYDLIRRTTPEQHRQITEGAARIADACGRGPVGFRAPGYTIDDRLFDSLEACGVEYDSSVFPCPVYAGAKAAAITLIGAKAAMGRGRASRSIIDTPRMLTAPADPYRRGRPFWTAGDGVLELPIGVTRGLRLPFIGTSVVLKGPAPARWLAKGMVGRPFVNLELHGIDLSDADADGLQGLREYQPDLRRTAEQKEVALRAAVSTLSDAGYRFDTLQNVAQSQRSMH